MSKERERTLETSPRATRGKTAAQERLKVPRRRDGGSSGGPHVDFHAAVQTPREEEERGPRAKEPANFKIPEPKPEPAPTTPEDMLPREQEQAEPSASPLPREKIPRESESQLRAIGLKKTFHKGDSDIAVLKGVDLEVHRGELLAIIGQSGSGKSTLLHLLATLDAPDEGEIYFNDERIDILPGTKRDRLRNRQLGMIFQFYHLLPELTTLENVLVPVMICRSAWQYLRHRRIYRQIATELLEMVGLSHRLRHTPRELSGGEMQRAAIARALITGPELLLADEPTGNLDQKTGRGILDLLYSLNRQHNLTIVMVTHDPAIAREADRVVRLADGRVEHA